MAVAQLKQLSEPSKLELMETEYELKAIEKEKDRAFNKASKQFDFYQEKHISTQNQIRAAEDAIRAMSVRGLALPKEHQSKDMADLVADNDTRYVDTLYDLNRDIEASIATDLDYLQELTLIRNNMQFGKELRMSQGAGTEVEYYQDEISKETLTREQWNGMNNTEKKQYIEHYKTSVGKNSAHEYVQTFTPTLMDDPNKYQMDSAYDPLNPHVKLSDSKTTQNVIQTWNASDGSVLYEARSANNRHYTQEQLREQFLDESSSPTSTSQEGLRDFHELERKGGYGQSRRYMTVDKMDEYFNKYQMKELEFDYDSKLMTGWDIDDDGTISHKEFEEAERATIKLMEENGQDVRGIKEGFWSGYESRTEIEAKNLQTKKDQLAFATAELDYKITEQQWNQANISTQDQTRLDAEKELLAIQEYRELSQLVKGVTTYNEKKGKEEYDKEKGKETGISFSRWKSAKEKIEKLGGKVTLIK